MPATSAPTSAKRLPVVIETDVVRATIDPDGAVLTHVELLKQKMAPDWTASGLVGLVTGKKDDPNRPVVLLEVNPQRVYVAQSGVVGSDAALPNHRTPFTVIEGPRTLEAGKDALDVTLSCRIGWRETRQDLHLSARPLRRDGQARGDQRRRRRRSRLRCTCRSCATATSRKASRRSITRTPGPVVYTEQDKFKKIEFSAIEKNKPDLPKQTQQRLGRDDPALLRHGLGAARRASSASTTRRTVEKNLYSIGMLQPLASLAPQASVTTSAQLYVGPQDQNALAKIAPGLDLVVDYGWLTFLAKPIFWLLEFLHGIVGNWGWAIVLLTVLIKAAFYPLSAASYKSMARMKEVTPRMMKLREQYGEDKAQTQHRDDGALQDREDQPARRLPADRGADPGIHLPLLGAAGERGDAQRPVDPVGQGPGHAGLVAHPAGDLMMALMWIQYKLNPTPPDPVQAKVMMFMPLIFGVDVLLLPGRTGAVLGDQQRAVMRSSGT